MDEPTPETPAPLAPPYAFTTAQVGKRLGVSPSLVRTWVAAMNWEVQRNAQGHRVFNEADLLQLEEMKAWLDQGHSLRSYQREVLGVGPFDPRKELFASQRKLGELIGRWGALQEAQTAMLERFREEGLGLEATLERVRQALGPEDPPPPREAAAHAGAAPLPGAELLPPEQVSVIIQGVLKQLLTSLLARQGRLQEVARRAEGERLWVEYLAPNGKRQWVEELCHRPADREQLHTILRLISPGP